jgi:D-arabinose 1-dehydrogenase-like Zn-dependent alcohol dehydrogenase
MTMPAVVLTAQGRIALQDRPGRGSWRRRRRLGRRPEGRGQPQRQRRRHLCVLPVRARPNFCRQATLETALGLQADGTLAPLMAAFPGHLRRIPDELETLEAAWVEPTASALRAVELAGELAGRTVLVTGGGPIGQLACRLAHLRSPAQILLMEPAAQRAQFGRDSHAVSIAADAAEGDAGGPGVDVVLECSGSAAATSAALKLLAPAASWWWSGRGPTPPLIRRRSCSRRLRCAGRTYIPTNPTARSTCWPPGKSRSQTSPRLSVHFPMR